MKASELVSRLDGVRSVRGGWKARCPAHDDKKPSLSIREQGERILLKCFAGCDTAAIVSALGLEMRDLFTNSRNGDKAAKPKAPARRVAAEYIYRDPEGKPLAKKIRYEPKAFAWQRFEKRKWVNGLENLKTPLYRLTEIKTCEWVVLTEGERDADAGAKIGLPTTTSGGVNSWREDHAESLRGKAVVIIPDADEPGRVHAQKMAESLFGKAASVKVFEIPDSKDLAQAIEKGMPREAFLALFADAPEWKAASGAELIRRFEEIFERYIVAASDVPLVGALYAFMTHCFKIFSWTPYLAFFSPLESCGKSHAADIVGWASARPVILVSITEAALFRLITEETPTVVVDEAEVLSGNGETAVALRAVLHAGCAPDDVIIRCAPNTHKLEKFSPWCPKVFCAIGKLPRVLASRCIVISMKRKNPNEKIKAFIRAKLKPEVFKLSTEIGAWVSQHEAAIRRAYESLSDESFGDRGLENFAPLEAILTVADPNRMPELRRVRLALTKASDSSLADDETHVQVLLDIRGSFAEKGVDELASGRLAEALSQIETSPWGEWSNGKPLSAAKLARFLKAFGIHPDRIGGRDSQARGYTLPQFQDAFTRYLPPESVNPSTTRENSGDGGSLKVSTKCADDTSENAVSPAKNTAGGHVDTFKPGIEGGQSETRIQFAEDEVTL